MSNPFGLPDEVFDAIIASAVRQGVASGMKRPNPAQKRPTAQEGAKDAKEIYDSYIAAGFNEVQAFELLKAIMTTKR